MYMTISTILRITIKICTKKSNRVSRADDGREAGEREREREEERTQARSYVRSRIPHAQSQRNCLTCFFQIDSYYYLASSTPHFAQRYEQGTPLVRGIAARPAQRLPFYFFASLISLFLISHNGTRYHAPSTSISSSRSSPSRQSIGDCRCRAVSGPLLPILSKDVHDSEWFERSF